jgi:hypothetical protein
MDQRTLEKLPIFDQLQADLAVLIEELRHFIARQIV